MSTAYPHPAAMDDKSLLAGCEIHRTRRSGPGGQHRNKTESAVVIVHRPTGVQAEAAERRSQAENLTHAVFRLRVRLALAVRGGSSPFAAPPSDLWRSRSGGGRIAVNPSHHDFPALLAEAIDALVAANFEVPVAAEQLGVTPSQLVKLLWLEPAAMDMVNRARLQLGMRALK